MIAKKQQKVNISERGSHLREGAQASVWQVYESRKTELREQGLTGEEYQAAIRRLVDELGV